MKKRNIIKYIAVIIALTFSLAFTAHADFGDYGGNADYGYDYNDYNNDYDYDDYEDDDYDNRNGGGMVYYDSSSDSDGSDFSAYAGKTIRLRFRMFDAKLFSLYFS